jgi:hypothetical protein
MIVRSFASDAGVWGTRLTEGTVPGLIGFDIGWTRGDHALKWLGMGPITASPLSAGDFAAALRDQDSNGHHISGTVKFQDLREFAQHRRVCAGSLRGEQRLRVPHLTSSEAFVLTGFTFEYESSDHHILQLKLRQMAHNDHVHVNLGDNDGAEPYRACVYYAVIPRSMLAHHLVQARSEAPARSEASQARTRGTALLQSFEFKFRNGDHHLQRIGVDLDDDQVLARFRDQDGNDPFSWMVEYSVLAD